MRTMAGLTFLKLTPILRLIVLGLQHVSGATLLPKGVPAIDDFGSVLLLLIYPFVGFESATVLSGETRSPKSTMPRALIRTQPRPLPARRATASGRTDLRPPGETNASALADFAPHGSCTTRQRPSDAMRDRKAVERRWC